MWLDPEAFGIWKRYMEKHYPNTFKRELRHHGTKGMKWGVRNGPPYPLDKSVKRSKIEDIHIQKSVGAKSKNYNVLDPDTGEIYHFVEGTRIRNPQVFAGKGGVKPLREAVSEGLSEKYGGKPENWQHCKGIGTIDDHGDEVEAEVHWFQEKEAGRHRFKIKKWRE